MRQKLRKYARDFETEIATFKENPDESEPEEEKEESSSEGEDMSAADFRKETVAPKFVNYT